MDMIIFWLKRVILDEGAKKEGPYDVILIEGAVEFIHEEIMDQLKSGGRI